jgi:hypothetical protein
MVENLVRRVGEAQMVRDTVDFVHDLPMAPQNMGRVVRVVPHQG